MEITYYTVDGEQKRELTQDEIIQFAEDGDKTAMKEILKQETKSATTPEQRLDAIEKFLGV